MAHYRVVRFGDYAFPPTSEVRDNFGNVVPRTTRLPGIDGGFDEFGVGRAPAEIGNVTVGFWLFASTPAEMTVARDAVNNMSDRGVERLVITPWGQTSERYTWARVNNISMPENAKDCPDTQQKVTINYQVADPFWYSDLGDVPTFGTFKFGDGTKFGGGGTIIEATGTETMGTVLNIGRAITFAKLSITAGAGGVSEVTVARIVNDVVRDSIAWDEALDEGDMLEVDGLASRVRVNGTDAYGDSFSFLHPDWMRLAPGANTLRVTLGVGESAQVEVRYYARWRGL